MKKILAFALAALLVVAMSVTAFAAPKSQEQETDPHVKQQDVDGKKVDFIIYDEDGDPVGDSDNYSDDGKKFYVGEDTYELLIVNYREKDNYPGTVKTSLEAAYEAIQRGDLDQYTQGKVLSALVYIGLKKTDASGQISYVGVNDIPTAKNLVVEFSNGYTLALNASGDTFAKVNDGAFVKVGEAGVFALYKDKTTGDGGGTSPQTGYESQTGIMVAVALVATVVAIVGTCYVVDKKRA